MDLPSFPLLFTFLLLLFLLVKRRNQKARLPPGPWKLPMIGNLHHLRGAPHHSLRNLAEKHGPLMHLQLGELSIIIISSKRMAKEVMKTHDMVFLNRHADFAVQVMTYGSKDLVFAPYSDYWRQLRKICVLELLSAKRVASFQSQREEEVTNLIQSISSMNGSVVNLSKKIFSFTNDMISRVAFGKKCKDKEVFISSVQESVDIAAGFTLCDFFPSLTFLRVITGMKSKIERIHGKVDRIIEDIIDEHKENKRRNMPNKDVHDEDLVDVLLRLQEDSDPEITLTTENIKAVILDIFSAGSETSSTVIEWAMSEMLRNPRVMKKAQAEVRQVLNGQNKIKETGIPELNYLKAVIKETLRLHPPLPLLVPRESRERCEIDGYEIPVKTKIIVNAWAISRDPESWNDAEVFYPERFLTVSVDYKGTYFEYIPFGAGRRICPGLLFAAANVELPLAQLLYNFNWKLPEGTKPEDLDMTESSGIIVRRKHDLYLTATRYTPQPE